MKNGKNLHYQEKNTHDLFVIDKFIRVSMLIVPGSSILDIGCHDSAILKFLPITDYTGIDADSVRVNDSIKKGLNVMQMDLNKHEISLTKQFDYVLLLDILEHVSNPRSLLDQSKRLLKKKGKIIITLPNDYHILNKIRFLFDKHLTKDPFAPYGHLHIFPIKSGENFLKQNDLKIIKKLIIPPIKPILLNKYIKNFLSNLFPSLFARDILYLLQPI